MFEQEGLDPLPVSFKKGTELGLAQDALCERVVLEADRLPHHRLMIEVIVIAERLFGESEALPLCLKEGIQVLAVHKIARQLCGGIADRADDVAAVEVEMVGRKYIDLICVR